jgi:uncharacterized protein YkwD
MLEKKIVKTHYHILFPLFLVLFLTVGVFIVVKESQKSQVLGTQTATTNCTVTSTQLAIKTQEQQLFSDINSYRSQQGIGQLTWSTVLKQSAAWLSSDMLAHNTLSHTDSLGRTSDIRLANCGYSIANGFGEAIADGSASADLVFNTWKNDPAHNQILLNNNYTIAGIDMEQGSNVFWAMDFGANSSSTIVPTTAVSISPPVTTGGVTISPPTTSNTPSSVPPSGTPSNEITPTTGPVAADMLINVSVKINGIGQDGNVTPKHLTRKVTAFVYSTGTTPVTTGTGFLTYDGSNYFTGIIHLGKLSQGPYLIKLVSDNTLQVLAQPAFQNLFIGKVNQIPNVTLYQGDLNGDNVLDINDYNIALPCFQSTTCNNTSLDFNDDTTINVLDYNLFLQSYEELHGD